MTDNLKGVTIAAGVAFLGSKYVFGKSTGKALIYAGAFGLLVWAALQIKVKVAVNAAGVGKATSPALPETDNTKGNINPETLPPIVFTTGKPLNNSAVSTLTDV